MLDRRAGQILAAFPQRQFDLAGQLLVTAALFRQALVGQMLAGDGAAQLRADIVHRLVDLTQGLLDDSVRHGAFDSVDQRMRAARDDATDARAQCVRHDPDPSVSARPKPQKQAASNPPAPRTVAK
ncbi:hypothetical protein D3C72_1318220 [compost metagenome]